MGMRCFGDEDDSGQVNQLKSLKLHLVFVIINITSS